MTFLTSRDSIRIGDTVIAYVNPSDMRALVVTETGAYHNRVGTFAYSEMVGKPFGTKMYGKNDKGFIYLLFPTPELWTLVLPHRTQILYNPDISLISTFLDLKPGVNMIESGTGSGSFTHSIARSIFPSGKLHSFEYHQERVSKAREEFAGHGLNDIVQVYHRDVCQDGFDLSNAVTAIFLDLPSPWNAIESAKEALDKSTTGRICCFSPCIEQVQKTVEKLKFVGFVEIKMFEVLVRPYDVRTICMDPIPEHEFKADNLKRKLEEGELKVLTSKPIETVRGHTSFLTFALLLPLSI